MESYARDFPDLFKLDRRGSTWTWTNLPMGICDTFTFGDGKTLPSEHSSTSVCKVKEIGFFWKRGTAICSGPPE